MIWKSLHFNYCVEERRCTYEYNSMFTNVVCRWRFAFVFTHYVLVLLDSNVPAIINMMVRALSIASLQDTTAIKLNMCGKMQESCEIAFAILVYSSCTRCTQ